MKRRIVIPAVAVGLTAATLLAHSWFSGSGALQASGTLEARNASIGSKVGGRITQVLVREGDRVTQGQLMLTFDDKELAAQLQQARGRYEQAQAAYAKMVRGSRAEDIAEARGASAYQEHAAVALRDDVARARADAANAQVNYDRAHQLASEGVVSQQFLDDADSRLKMTKAALAAAEHTLAASQGSVTASQAALERAVRGNRAEDIAAAKADMESARGDVELAQARFDEREVRAPSNAVVEVLDARPGDLVQANAPVAKILEADQLYVMVYVPEPEIGRVKIGQRAQVSVDSFPGQSFSAVVEQIRQQAEFLPRNVQTQEERVHQVMGVKLRVENRDNLLRAGVTADVHFQAETK